MNSNTAENTTSARRHSFSNFMKNLLLLVSPSNVSNEEDLGLKRESSSTSSENSPFQDLYFSFPAFEEFSNGEESSTASSCGHQSYMAQSSSIMC